MNRMKSEPPHRESTVRGFFVLGRVCFWKQRYFLVAPLGAPCACACACACAPFVVPEKAHEHEHEGMHEGTQPASFGVRILPLQAARRTHRRCESRGGDVAVVLALVLVLVRSSTIVKSAQAQAHACARRRRNKPQSSFPLCHIPLSPRPPAFASFDAWTRKRAAHLLAWIVTSS